MTLHNKVSFLSNQFSFLVTVTNIPVKLSSPVFALTIVSPSFTGVSTVTVCNPTIAFTSSQSSLEHNQHTS